MNDRYTLSTAARIASLVFAVLATLSLVAGVDQLAQPDHETPQIAQAAATQQG